LGFLGDDFSLFFRKGVSHNEGEHNLATDGRFIISSIAGNERKTCLNFQTQGAVIPKLYNHLMTTSF
jgi:hypothetical protein